MVMDGVICPAPWYSLHFFEAGRVFTCCTGWVRSPVGNLRKRTISEIWNGPEIQSMRKKMLEGAWQEICRPSCPFIQWHLSGGRFIKFADLERHGVTPAAADEIRAGRTVVSTPPTVFNFSNSGYCNLKCIMCNTGLKEDKDLLERAYNDFITYLPTARKVILSGWGDPFARPDTRKILTGFDGSRYPDLKFSLITNGLLLRKYWDRIKHQNFAGINISVDAATKETYEKIRVGGKWEDLLANLDLVREVRGRFDNIVINMTVMRANYKEIPAFVDFGESYGFNVVFQKITGRCGDQNFFLHGDRKLIAEVKAMLQGIQDARHTRKISIDVESNFGNLLSGEDAEGERRLHALLNYWGWKLTAPVSKAVELLKGRPGSHTFPDS